VNKTNRLGIVLSAIVLVGISIVWGCSRQSEPEAPKPQVAATKPQPVETAPPVKAPATNPQAKPPAPKDDGGVSAKDLDLPPPQGPLSVSEALKSFKLPEGLKMECVASEPLVEDPVAVQWDARGRMWVVEMRGYMGTIDGGGEDQPVGRISILEDTKGNGIYDKKTIFLDKLVMPRTVSLVGDGALVAVPPNLYYCRDSKGDGHCDEQTLVAADYAKGGTVEHQPNGLVWMMDNYLYSAKSSARYHYDGHGKFSVDPTAFRGQWGICQDDVGRIFYNYNSDGLRGDIVPSEYAGRNPHYRNAVGVNVKISPDQHVFPARKNLTNRSYKLEEVGPNGKLLVYTSACAPLIYRGDVLPAKYYGNAFIAEPAGELVRRDFLDEEDAIISGYSVHGEMDFLASTDERFRPVNIQTGPDGAMYIVDMYRGVIQDKVFVSPFLRRQSLARGLDKGLHYGRIYRIAPDGFTPPAKPHLAEATSVELVKSLSHANGWYRDTAQRLLVERALDKTDLTTVDPLKELALKGENPLGRLHAVWTLDGMKKLDEKTVVAALSDQDGRLRAAAIRLIEPLLRGKSAADLMPRVLALSTDADPSVRLQFALSLSPFTAADDAMFAILAGDSYNAYLRDAVISGLNGRELAMLEKLMKEPAFGKEAVGRSSVLLALAQCVFADGKRHEGIQTLLRMIADLKPGDWRQLSLLDGVVGVVPREGKAAMKPKAVRLDGPPPELSTILKMTNEDVHARAVKLDKLIVWVGKPGVVVPPPPPPLTAAQQARFEAGKALYQTTCGACHQPTGLGHEGLAPPLVSSEWVDGSPARIARIVLNGLDGPIKVNGATYQLEMPPMKALDDEQLASLMTYIRREWDHEAGPVEAALVANVRKETEKREAVWNVKELMEIQ
jgi:mono/diheme cytochrome c family protein/glucose/arabinose dehydrogenase